MKKNRFTLSVLFLLCLSISAIAQTRITLQGSVVDQDNQPVIGASIIEKGTTNGTMTNLDGKFVIKVSAAKSVVRISYMGYENTEIVAANASQFARVKLRQSSVALTEVVAIGYGVVKKNDATGSVTAIKPDKLNRGLTTNAQDMISGKVAGVVVTSGGGTPGGGATIRIRGGSSLSASNDPLIVIDGLAMDNEGIKGVANGLSTVNPNDIESFTVLKDASATAIYGSRASNGVIIITTKKGIKGSKARVSYDGNISISMIKKTLDVLTADKFRNLVDSLDKNKSTVLAKLGTANTDWQKQIYRTAISHDHNINITGGLKNMPYRISAGYTNQDGIIKTSNFERYTGAISLSPSFFDDHLRMNLNAKGMIVKNRYADGGVVGAAASMDPTQPVTSADPLFAPFGGYWEWLKSDGSANNLAIRNPVATLNQKSDVSNATDFIGSAEFDYKFHFLPDLRAHLNLGINASDGKQDLYIDLAAAGNSPYGREGWDKMNKTNKSLNFFMQYDKTIHNHKFDLMGGYEWQHFYRESSSLYQGLIKNVYNKDLNDSVGYNYEKSVPFKTESYLVSFFGRLNYSYANKYLLTATVREDGTSRFGPKERWGLFPAAAFAWKINEEAFLKNTNLFSDFKLRLGYGITGQQNIGQGDYPYIPVYTANQVGAYYEFDSIFVNTSRPDAYNPKLKWEETTTWNAGLDMGIFKNRITASLDYYYRITNDLINVVSVPSGTNFRSKVISNVGSLTNKGVEFSINAKAISTKDMTWELAYNVTYNQNKITKLTTGNTEGYIVETGGTFQGQVKAHAVNQASNSFYVYKQRYDSNGKPIESGANIDPKNPSLGKYKDVDAFVDVDTNGIINAKDKYFYHNQDADITMGFASKFIYKNFDFGFTLRASIGNYIYNSIASGNLDVSEKGVWNPLLFFNNKPASALENNFQGTSTKTFLSDMFVQNGSFVRCDNITVGYSFKNLFNAISNGRIYATVQNPFVLTKYKGLDPEIYGGIDNNIYPRALITVIGVSLNF